MQRGKHWRKEPHTAYLQVGGAAAAVCGRTHCQMACARADGAAAQLRMHAT